MRAPSTSGTFEPTVVDRRPDTGPTNSIPTVAGTMKTPAAVTEAPNPNPVDSGSSTNCGTSTNDENMPKPMTSAARFVVQTGRSRIICMSTSGAALRDSTLIQSGNTTAATVKKARVRVESHPHDAPSLMGTRNATSHPASRIAPSGSMRPGVRTGDSGTNAMIPAVAASTANSGNQKSQW